MYSEEDFLNISGIRHFAYCKRSWALVVIENQWIDNFFTVDGVFSHERVHDVNVRSNVRGIVGIRGMPVNSFVLGVSGDCDLVEFVKDPNGVPVKSVGSGLYMVRPVEYKRGKHSSMDGKLQLVLQGLCLSEMFCVPVNYGFVYHIGSKIRERVDFTDDLIDLVKQYVFEMHNLVEKGYTPKVKYSKKCDGCSLFNVCVSTIFKKTSANSYIESVLGD